MLTQERLKQLIRYDPVTGFFSWRTSGKGVNKDLTAGCIDGDGYVRIGIDNEVYSGQILAWLYIHGYFSENQIDHENRIRSDNRQINLREVSNSCNIRNRSIFKNNTSGVTGVHFDNKKEKWYASIRVNYKRIFLGCHQDFGEAVCHRLAAEQAENWSGCDSSSTAYKYVKENISRRSKGESHV